MLGAVSTGAARRSSAAPAAATPTVAELVGGVTSGFSPNRFPDGVTTGPDGHVWFTEFGNPGGIGRVNDDLSVTELVGGTSPGFSLNNGAEAIAVGPGTRLWVAECNDPGRLAQVLEGGKVSEATGGVRPGFSVNSQPGCVPGGITTDPGGNLWFTEYADPGRIGEVANGSIHELTAGATRGFTVNRGPSGITRGPDGRIWFTEAKDPGGVGRVNGDGSVTELTGGVTRGFTKNAQPLGIAAGPDGHIWFAEQGGRVGRVNDDGTVSELVAGVTQGFRTLSRPFTITTGPDGRLWFTDFSDPGGVARINDDGTVTEFLGGVTPGLSKNAGPSGIATGPDGRLWFAEYNAGGIGRITVGPGVVTGAARDVAATSATLEGTVRANGQQTVFHFEYGPTSAYGSETAQAAAGTGAAAQTVSATLSGLTAGTLYHYRLVATNDTDTTVGKDATFTTAAATGGASTGGDKQAPTAPGLLAGRFVRGSLRLTWKPASDNTGVDHYRLSRDGKPLDQSLPASSTGTTLRGFRTGRRTLLTLAAFDAAGNAGPGTSLVVTPRPRPKGVPKRIPAWATKLLAFQTQHGHGKRPKTPAKVPSWYPRWKAWRLNPYRIVTG